MLKILLSTLAFLVICVLSLTPPALFYVGVSFLKAVYLSKFIATSGILIASIYLFGGIASLHVNSQNLIQTVIYDAEIKLRLRTLNKVLIYYSIASFLVGGCLAICHSFPLSWTKSQGFVVLTTLIAIFVVVVFFDNVVNTLLNWYEKE